MDRNGFLTVIFLFLIVSDCSSAHSIWNLRKLIEVAPPKDKSPATTVPSPNSNGMESKASPVDGVKSGGNKPKDHPDSLDDSTKVNNPKDSKKGDDQNTTNPKDSKKSGDQNTTNPNDSKKSDDQNTTNPKDLKKSDDQNTTTSANPNPTKKQMGNEKNPEGKGKTDTKTDVLLGNNGSCEGSTKMCSVKKTLIACIQGLDSGSKDLVLLIKNEGESTLKVNITIATSLKKLMNESEILKRQTIGINVSETIGQSTQIVVNAGNGECKLDMGPGLSIGDFLQRLPPYYKQVTPIYGAYLLFLIALIVVGTWACCKFRKRRRHDGVPYQELEMGLPESASAVNLEAAEGWDEGWDDDWDEDNAVKSPGGPRVGSISASGLTARSTNKDGWEKDWDD